LLISRDDYTNLLLKASIPVPVPAKRLVGIELNPGPQADDFKIIRMNRRVDNLQKFYDKKEMSDTFLIYVKTKLMNKTVTEENYHELTYHLWTMNKILDSKLPIWKDLKNYFVPEVLDKSVPLQLNNPLPEGRAPATPQFPGPRSPKLVMKICDSEPVKEENGVPERVDRSLVVEFESKYPGFCSNIGINSSSFSVSETETIFD